MNQNKRMKTKYYQWQLLAQKGGECGMCHQHAATLTVDHIIPMWFLTGVGFLNDIIWNDEENFQLVCRPCNILKGGRFYLRNPKTLPLMRKYMAMLEKEYAGLPPITHYPPPPVPAVLLHGSVGTPKPPVEMISPQPSPEAPATQPDPVSSEPDVVVSADSMLEALEIGEAFEGN